MANTNQDIKRIHAASADIISGAQATIEKQWAFANDSKRIIVHEVGGAFSQFPNSTEVILKTGAVAFTGDQSHGGYGLTAIRDATFLDIDTLTVDRVSSVWEMNTGIAGQISMPTTGRVDFAKSLSIKGANAPTTGTSVEIDYGGIASTGRVIAYDRTGAVYKDLRIGTAGTFTVAGDLTGLLGATFSDTDTLTIDHASGLWSITSSVAEKFVATAFVFEDADEPTNDLFIAKSAADNWFISTGTTADIEIAGKNIFLQDADFALGRLIFSKPSGGVWSIASDTTCAMLISVDSFTLQDAQYTDGDLIFNKTGANIWQISSDTTCAMLISMISFTLQDTQYQTGDLVFDKTDADTWNISSDTTQKLTIGMSNIRISPIVYDDWRWGAAPHDPPGAMSPATLVEIGSTSTFAWTFTNGKILVFSDLQLPHSYKEGTDIPLHIHWAPTTTATYTGYWQLFVTGWVSTAAGTAVSTVVTPTATFNASLTANQIQLTDFSAALAGAGRKISSIITATLELSLSAGTSCMLLGLDGHYQVDSFGSTSASGKDS